MRAQRIGLGIAVALGLLDAWRYLHYQANPDGVSYLDIAREVAAHGPAALVNGYWSPLLPALAGIAYRIVPPTIDTMYPTAHVVTFLSFAACALSYDQLLSASRKWLEAGGDAPPGRQVVLVAIGWAAFALVVVKGIGMQLITPDMGVAAVVFWMAAEAFSLGDGAWRPRRWAFAGAVLAVGYWWKAIVFPVALVWLSCASLAALRRRDGVRGPATGWFAFAALAAALAVPVSLQTGRPTFGETGRLNYLWYVDAAPYVWERCLPPEARDGPALRFGSIARDSLIAESPLTCSLDSRAAGATMPLWYDPSVYYRSAIVRPDAEGQWRAVKNDVGYVIAGAIGSAPVLFTLAAAVAIVVAGLATRKLVARGPAAIGPRGMILGPLIAAPIAFYIAVYVEFRHVAPFLLTGIVLVVLAVARSTKRFAAYALGGLLAAAAVDVVWRLSTPTLIALALARSTLQGRAGERIPETQIAARELAARGLEPGTRVAAIGNAWNPEWAQLAGLRIRAHVPEVTTSLLTVVRDLADDPTRRAWDAALRENGIRAAVAYIPSGVPAPPEFERLGDTGFYLHPTDGAQTAPGQPPGPPASRAGSRASSEPRGARIGRDSLRP